MHSILHLLIPEGTEAHWKDVQRQMHGLNCTLSATGLHTHPCMPVRLRCVTVSVYPLCLYSLT